MNEPSRILLQASDVRFSYRSADGARTFELMVDDFDVRAGEFIVLCGASGSGKSTLLSILAGMLRPDAGKIQFVTDHAKQDLYDCTKDQWRALRRAFGIVYQDPSESLNDRRTLLDIVMDPLRIHRLPTGAATARHGGFGGLAALFNLGGRSLQRTQREAALAVLSKVGIAPQQSLRSPRRLSGGQRQRVAIARALVARPQLLFLDEPTSALDVSVQASVVGLLAALRRENPQLGFVFVTHDMALARQLADRIAVLDEGRVVEFGDADEVFRSPASPAARRLLSMAQWSRLRDRDES